MKGKRKPSFNAKAFLSSVDDGRTIATYRQNQKVFSQGDPADPASRTVVMMFHVEDRTYNPEDIVVLGSAFDRAFGALSTWTTGNTDNVRERLARIILWRFDLGERDPARLSNFALHTLADGWPRDESATGGERLSTMGT